LFVVNSGTFIQLWETSIWWHFRTFRIICSYAVVQCTCASHHIRETVQLMHRNMPNFTSLDIWPSNSPDLNPVDY